MSKVLNTCDAEKHRVFISYRSKKDDMIEAMIEKLLREGNCIWFDPELSEKRRRRDLIFDRHRVFTDIDRQISGGFDQASWAEKELRKAISSETGRTEACWRRRKH